MPLVYLGLGSNLGDTKKNLQRALTCLRSLGTVKTVSSSYHTEPVGFTDQPWFLNAVLELRTDLMPEELMRKILRIEKNFGRERRVHNGPRIIDIDILFYDSLVVDEFNLKIPHPRLHERRFVLEPLAEITPQFSHPIFEKKVEVLLNECPDRNRVARIVNRQNGYME